MGGVVPTGVGRWTVFTGVSEERGVKAPVSVSSPPEQSARDGHRNSHGHSQSMACARFRKRVSPGASRAFTATVRHGRMADINKINTSERKRAARGRRRRYRRLAADQHISRSEAAQTEVQVYVDEGIL